MVEEVVVMVEEALDSFFAEGLALIVDIVRYINSNWIWECGGFGICRFICLLAYLFVWPVVIADGVWRW